MPPIKGLSQRLFALLGVVLIIAGCASFLVPSTRDTFTFDGMERSYRLYRPQGLSTSAPLVVVLHAIGATTVDAEQNEGWDKQADIHKFVVAYPEGVDWSWNAHGCCGKAAEENINDVGFINAVIDRISGIDRSRIYATGLSNGGIMAYTLACNLDLFAAIGPVAATQIDSCPAPHPTSVMHIHGLKDETVRFGGTPRSASLTVDGAPVPDVNAFWRRVDACEPPVITDEGYASTAMCADNREVVLATYEGGHSWPRNAERALWSFFTKHSK